MKLRLLRFIFFVLAIVNALLLQHVADAQNPFTVSVQPQEGTLEDVFRVEISVDTNSSPDVSAPVFERSNNFKFLSQQTVSRSTLGLGVTKQQLKFVASFVANYGLKPGSFALPKAYLLVDGRKVTLEPGTVKLLPVAKDPANSSKEELTFIQSLDNLEPYVGEQVIYLAEISATDRFLRGTMSDLDLSGFNRFSLEDKAQKTSVRGALTVRTFAEVLIPAKSGKLVIPVRTLNAKLKQAAPRSRSRLDFLDDAFGRESLFGSVFAGDEVVERRFLAKDIEINVRPTPPSPISSQNFVPVGSLELVTNYKDRTVAQGESIALSLIFSGPAYLNPLELPALENTDDFKIYGEVQDLKTEIKGNKIYFTKTFSLSIVPLKTGEIFFPKFRVATFDAKQQKFHIIETPNAKLSVLPSSQESEIRAVISPEVNSNFSDNPDTSQQKQALHLMGKDIMPQRKGQETTLRRSEPRSLYLVLALVVIPLASLFCRTLLSIGLGDEFWAKLIRTTPVKRALKDVGRLRRLSTSRHPKEIAVSLQKLLLNFVKQYYKIESSCSTLREAIRLLEEKQNEVKLITDLREITKLLEQFVYASGASKDHSISDILTSADATVRKHGR